MMKKITLLILLSFVFTGGNAFASFRCGPKLVTIGNNKIEVIGKCGEPSFTEVTSIVTERGYQQNLPDGRSNDKVTELVEKWYYNCGPHNFIKILTFRGGRLIDIKTGDYGSGDSDCVGAENRKRRDDNLPSSATSPKSTSSSESSYGRISVFGLPNLAKVYLDDKYVGEMPVVLDYIEEGPHNVLVKKASYQDWFRTVFVKPGETVHLEVYLDTNW